MGCDLLKPIVQIYPMLPTANEDERARQRPVGRNRELYQDALTGWRDIVMAADELGFWGAASIEHHFWSEGYEVGPSPSVISAYWAAQTKNIRVGALGYVMSTQNPIRVAEETAIIDHMTRGRSFVGFARGFQSRWTNIVGQHLGARATKSPAVHNSPTSGGGPALPKDVDDDAINRAIVEEQIEIVLKAWTEESMEHNGKYWQIPFPYKTGVDDWPLGKAGITGKFGAPGEVDESGSVRRVSVCPAPYTKPHPPVFLSGSGSPETITYCAKKGIIPVYFTNIDTAERLNHLYMDTAAQEGRHWKSGQNQCLVRWMQIGATDADARQAVMDYDYDIWKNFYGPMRGRTLTKENAVDAILGTGFYTVGSVETVRDDLVRQWKKFPAEYITLIFHYAQMPKEAVIENMTLFMKHIKPALDEVIAEAARG